MHVWVIAPAPCLCFVYLAARRSLKPKLPGGAQPTETYTADTPELPPMSSRPSMYHIETLAENRLLQGQVQTLKRDIRELWEIPNRAHGNWKREELVSYWSRVFFPPSPIFGLCQFLVGRASRLNGRCWVTKCRSWTFVELLCEVRRWSFPVPHVIPSVRAALLCGRRKAGLVVPHGRSGGGPVLSKFSIAIDCRPS